MSVSGELKYVGSSSVAMSELDGGIALLDLDRNVYFSLNRTGAVVWKALEQPTSLDDICGLVADKFAVSADKCRSDVAKLLNKLVEARLARIADAAAG